MNTTAKRLRDMMKEMIWGMAVDGQTLAPAEFPNHIATWLADATTAWYRYGITTNGRAIGQIKNDRGEKLGAIISRAADSANEFFPVYCDDWLAIIATAIITTIKIDDWN